jgi:hypothetical protein
MSDIADIEIDVDAHLWLRGMTAAGGGTAFLHECWQWTGTFVCVTEYYGMLQNANALDNAVHFSTHSGIAQCSSVSVAE